mmetsp:Transcript_106282/g.307633  ORF Transcript_106282/g.307633 Transcript_106282/m.307633 type:complete len:298 (+) Transcript_106282:844-1737(+)
MSTFLPVAASASFIASSASFLAFFSASCACRNCCSKRCTFVVKFSTARCNLAIASAAFASPAPVSLLTWTRVSSAQEACSSPKWGTPDVGEDGGEGEAPANVLILESCVTQVMMRSVARSAASRNLSKVRSSFRFGGGISFGRPWFSFLSARIRSASARSRSASARAVSAAKAFSAASFALRNSSISDCMRLMRSLRAASSAALPSSSFGGFVFSTSTGIRKVSSCFAQPKPEAMSQTAPWNSASISREPKSLERATACNMRTIFPLLPIFRTTRFNISSGSSMSAKLLPSRRIWSS